MSTACPLCGSGVPAGAFVFDEAGRTIRNHAFVERLTAAETIIFAHLFAARPRFISADRLRNELADGLGRKIGPVSNNLSVLIVQLREKLAVFGVPIKSEKGTDSRGYRLVMAPAPASVS